MVTLCELWAICYSHRTSYSLLLSLGVRYGHSQSAYYSLSPSLRINMTCRHHTACRASMYSLSLLQSIRQLVTVNVQVKALTLRAITAPHFLLASDSLTFSLSIIQFVCSLSMRLLAALSKQITACHLHSHHTTGWSHRASFSSSLWLSTISLVSVIKQHINCRSHCLYSLWASLWQLIALFAVKPQWLLLLIN